MHNYVVKEHGWQTQGLEPQGMRASGEVTAMVAALVEAYQSDRGLSLADVAAMVSVLERPILDELTTLLHASHFLNDMSTSKHVVHSELHETLQSYLLLVEMGMRADLQNATLHQMVKERRRHGQGLAYLGESRPTSCSIRL